MQVICTNTIDFTNAGMECTPGINSPEVGDICDVERETYSVENIPCYKLVGWDQFIYDRRNFSIVESSTDDEVTNKNHQQWQNKTGYKIGKKP
jgi:hypothetical protein